MVSLGLPSKESEDLTRITALVEADTAFFWRLGTLSMLCRDVNALQISNMKSRPGLVLNSINKKKKYTIMDVNTSAVRASANGQ